MTTRNVEATLRVGADISGAIASLARLQDRAQQVGRQINRATAGGAGVAARGAGGAVGGIGTLGRAAAAGAGIGAGLAAVEQIFGRLFELFENTPVLEQLTDAFGQLLRGIAPIAGVILQALTPAIVALEPALTALAPAIAPLIELLGAGLLLAIQGLTPVIQQVARLMTAVNRFVRDLVIGLLDWIGRQLSRIPGVNIDLAGQVQTDTLAGIEQQLADVERERTRELNKSIDEALARALEGMSMDDRLDAIRQALRQATNAAGPRGRPAARPGGAGRGSGHRGW